MFFKQMPDVDYFDEIVKEVLNLVKITKFSPDVGHQLSLQVCGGTDSSDESWWQSIGKITTPERTLIEKKFNTIHPALKNTKIEKWINSMIEYGIVRTRLLIIPPKTTYSVHKDPTPRIHLPIVTNKHSYICLPDYSIMKHLPADATSWWIDTRHNHTAINCGLEPRIHIVGVVTNY
jgi:hypothetical protein